jgi:hypothetical protein
LRRAVEPLIGTNARRASFQPATTLVPLAQAGRPRATLPRLEPTVRAIPMITVRSATPSLRLALWNEDRKRLVGLRDVTPANYRQ